MRIITWLLLFLIIPCTSFARYKAADQRLPDLKELSSIVFKGSDEEKINSLSRFYKLSSNREYWKLQENWEPLSKLLSDDSPFVRAETVRFCAQLPRSSTRGAQDPFIDPDSNPAVHTILIPGLRLTLHDSAPEVRKEACKAIIKYKDLEATSLLDRLLDDQDPWIQFEAIVALSQLAPYSSSSIFNHLLDLLDRNKSWPYVLIQREALHCMQKLQLPPESRAHFFSVMKKKLSTPYLTRGIINLLFGKFDSLTPEDRGYLFSLLQIKDKRIPLLVLQNLQDRSPAPAVFVQSSDPAKQMECNPRPFSEIKDENGNNYDLVKLLTPLLSSVHPEIREAVTNVIRRAETKSATELLISLADDSDPKVREDAISGLLHDKDPKITALLRSRVNDPDDKVRQTATRVAAVRMKNERSSELKTFLLNKLHDPYPPIRLDVARQLLKINAPELLEEIIPFLSDKGMNEVFEQLIGGNSVEKVYILRGSDGGRIVTTDRKQVPVGTYCSVKFIHNQAAEFLLDYLATCKGDCLVWQKQLVKFEHEGVEPYLLELTNSSAAEERIFAVQQLGAYGTDRALPKIKSLLDDQDMRVVKIVYKTIRRLHYPELVPLIINNLKDRNKLIRGYALEASNAFTITSAKMIDALIPLLKDPNNKIRAKTLTTLYHLNYSRFVETAIHMLQDRSEDVQRSALIGLRTTPPSSGALHLLLGLIDDYESKKGFHQNAVFAVQVIGKIGDSAAVEPLLDLIERGSKKIKTIESRDVIRSSIDALGVIGSQEAVVSLVRLLDFAPCGRDAYRVLRKNFNWAEVQDILKNEPDGKKLRIIYERQFPEKEEFISRLDKLIEEFQSTSTKPPLKKEQWPAISSRYALQKQIRAGTLRMDQGQELKSLLLSLLDDKSKNVVRNAAKDLAQMKVSSALTPIENAIQTECTGTSISPIINDLIRSLHKLGGKDVIPFLVRELDCPAPLASFHIECALRKKFTTDEIYAALKKAQDHSQLVKTYKHHFLPDFKGEKLRNKRLQPQTDSTAAVTISPLHQPPILLPPSPLKMASGFQKPRSKRLENKTPFRLPHDQAVDSRSEIKKCEDIVPRLMVSHPEKMTSPIFSKEKLIRLKGQLQNGAAAIRRKAADQLGDSYDLSVAKSLIPQLKDRNPYVRQAAARSLGKLRAIQGVQPLVKLMDDEDQYVQAWAAFGLHRMNNSLAEDALTRHQEKSDPDRLERVNKLLSGYP